MSFCLATKRSRERNQSANVLGVAGSGTASMGAQRLSRAHTRSPLDRMCLAPRRSALTKYRTLTKASTERLSCVCGLPVARGSEARTMERLQFGTRAF